VVEENEMEMRVLVSRRVDVRPVAKIIAESLSQHDKRYL
jgi:hypothetical protein